MHQINYFFIIFFNFYPLSLVSYFCSSFGSFFTSSFCSSLVSYFGSSFGFSFGCSTGFSSSVFTSAFSSAFSGSTFFVSSCDIYIIHIYQKFSGLLSNLLLLFFLLFKDLFIFAQPFISFVFSLNFGQV